MTPAPTGRPEDRPGYQAAVEAVTADVQPTQFGLRRIAEALEAVRLAAQSDPVAGSPRAVDVTNLGDVTVSGYDAWEDQPLDSAHSTVGLALYAIGQEIEAMARALDQPPLVYADVVLMRSIVETAARGWWILEPGLPPRDRAGRYITERLHGLHQLVLLFQGQPPTAGPAPATMSLQHWLDREAGVRTAAEQAGFPVKNGGHQGFHVGAKRQSSTKLIDLLFEVAGLGRAAYHDASAVAHGATAGLLSRRVGTFDGEAGQHFARIGPDPHLLRITAALAVLATSQLVDRLIAYDSLQATGAGLTWTGVSQTVLADLLAGLDL